MQLPDPKGDFISRKSKNKQPNKGNQSKGNQDFQTGSSSSKFVPRTSFVVGTDLKVEDPVR